MVSGARASVAEDVERAPPIHSFAVRAKTLCKFDAQRSGGLQLRERRGEPRLQLLPPRELDTDVATRGFVVACPSQDAFASKNTRDRAPEAETMYRSWTAYPARRPIGPGSPPDPHGKLSIVEIYT